MGAKMRAVLMMALLFMVGLTVQGQTDCSTKTVEGWVESASDHFINLRYAESIPDYTCAIELGSQSADIYYRRAYAYYEQGMYAEAIVDYTSAIELDEN